MCQRGEILTYVAKPLPPGIELQLMKVIIDWGEMMKNYRMSRQDWSAITRIWGNLWRSLLPQLPGTIHLHLIILHFFLSPSGDLGIGLVWHNLSPLDHPTPPTFWSHCWNPLQTELNYLWWVRCSQLFSNVFSWVVNFMHNHPLRGHFFSGYPQSITDIL